MPKSSRPPLTRNSGEPNWAHQTMWTRDNLDIMRGMNSDSVDLIYLDPPFNSNANYAAPIGSQAAGAAFKDTWGLDDISLAWHGEIKHEYPGLYDMLLAVRTIHGDSMMAYLIYMAPRIMEMKRLLKDTGSIYLHCDPTASHYLKIVMDSIFNRRSFRNEIVWSYQRWTGATKRFQRMHDTLLYYAMSKDATFNRLTEPYSAKSKHAHARRSAIVDGRLEQNYTTDSSRQKSMRDVWEISYLNSQAKERTGYPTQKPLALLRRIVKASSNADDMVLDPFCGCATACIAAEMENRQWAGIDISPKALELVKSRMHKELNLFFQGAHRSDIPKRTDLGAVRRYNAPENKQQLYGLQGGYCNGCEGHFESRNLEIDHIIPKKKGGTDHISNLQLLCGACNRTKGNRTQEYLIACLTDKGWIKRKKKAE